MILKYRGTTATKRIIRPEDFKRFNVDHPKVVFDVVDIMTRGQAELTDEAAQVLLRAEPNSFSEVDEEDRALAFRTLGTSGAGEDSPGDK